jgi:hypothetical protein
MVAAPLQLPEIHSVRSQQSIADPIANRLCDVFVIALIADPSDMPTPCIYSPPALLLLQRIASAM